MKQLSIFDFLSEKKSMNWEDHQAAADLLAASNLSTNILKYALSAKYKRDGAPVTQYYVLLDGNVLVCLSISANTFYHRTFEVMKGLSQRTLSGFNFVEVE